MKEKQKAVMRKGNMKLYPIYTMFGLDFMFYYGIELLFLTQVKGISDADYVFASSMYALFYTVLQIPLTILVEKIGKRKSILIRKFIQYIIYNINYDDKKHMVAISCTICKFNSIWT